MKKRIVCGLIIVMGMTILSACGDRKTQSADNNGHVKKETEGISTVEEQLTPAANEILINEDFSEVLLQVPPEDLYDKCMKIANEKQKQQLMDLQLPENQKGRGLPEEYIRKIKTIMGLMPEDAPRLTREEAQRIISEMNADGYSDRVSHMSNIMDVSELCERFSEVAYAPDIYGGSGMNVIQYWVDDECTAFIDVPSATIVAYVDVVNNTTEFLYLWTSDGSR
ncbi:MAG: hypothetical protein IJM57_04060 [Lachnospiraceae bacterium]|nr:hypothetical protein [Lachnospiraceae bacterium]